MQGMSVPLTHVEIDRIIHDLIVIPIDKENPVLYYLLSQRKISCSNAVHLASKD